MKIYILNIFRCVQINLILDNCLMETGVCVEGYGGIFFFKLCFFFNRIFAISLPDKENTSPNLPEKVYLNLFSVS